MNVLRLVITRWIYTSKMHQEIFKEVKYSECEEKRKIEQDIIYNWINILDEVESGILKEFIQIGITSAVEKERNVKIKLEDVLFFLTRSKYDFEEIQTPTMYGKQLNKRKSTVF